MNSLRTGAPRRAVAGVALVLAAATATMAAAPGADARRLPGGSINKKLVDGSTVKARLYDEGVRYHRGNVANIGTSREVWVSGKIVANIGGGAKGAHIYGGYVVGCQVNLIGVDGNGNAGNNPWIPNGGMMGNSGTTLHIGPGQAGWVPIIQAVPQAGGNPLNTFTFRGNRGGLAYSQEGFRVNGCAGHASARARFTIEVETETVRAQVVLWGKPFTLGG
ncbi:MAG: MspA family porin [Gordonia sp. (in: high G+C Gram-positive bacteria)]|uniref:MspA family porin n=1 Tax=Gordonia sp. (in: high G+C Gram-positive bacteria) TaxID=84139 RepID=UPI0039E4E357